MDEANPAPARWWADPLVWVELFAVSNLAFLAVDIFLAHSVNAFEHAAEWVPVLFSLLVSPLLVALMMVGGPRPTLAGPPGSGTARWRQRLARGAGLATGWGCLLVGVSGLLLHLDSQFFAMQTLKNLVYTAPFAAPLSYAGLGLLLILDRMVDARSTEWARWVIVLALGGFVGNLVLSLADHAQNGFFRPEEWLAVIAAALAVGSLSAMLIFTEDRALLAFCVLVMAIQVSVGLLGFYAHVMADLSAHETNLWDKVIYGAPIFAPLLFADLAILAVLGLWALARNGSRAGGLAPTP